MLSKLMNALKDIITISALSQIILLIIIFWIGLAKFSILVGILSIISLLGLCLSKVFGVLFGKKFQDAISYLNVTLTGIWLLPIMYCLSAFFLEAGFVVDGYLRVKNAYDIDDKNFSKWIYFFLDKNCDEEVLSLLFDLRKEWEKNPPIPFDPQAWKLLKTILFIVNIIIRR